MVTKDAVQITWETCVGVIGTGYPLGHGNCFSLRCSDDSFYKIVNFVVENLRQLLDKGLAWPIKIVPISESVALIHDTRIPDAWYKDWWCEICCPKELLPPPQRYRHYRQMERGERVEGKQTITIDPSKRPKIGT